MKRYILLLFCLLTIGGIAHGDSAGDLYNNALQLFYRNNYNEALKVLEKVNGNTRPEKYILASKIYFEKGDSNKASSYLQKYPKHDVGISNYLDYFQAKIWLTEEKTDLVEKKIQELQKRTAPSFFIKQLRLELAEAYLKSGKFSAMSDVLSQLTLKEDELDPVTYPEVIKLYIKRDLATNDRQNAVNWYHKLIKLFPEADKTNELRNEIRQRFSGGLTADRLFDTFDEQLTYLEALFRRQEYIPAASQARYIASSFSNHPEIYKVYEILGIINFRIHRYEVAQEYLEKAMKAAPPVEDMVQSWYYRARSMHNANDYAEAKELYKAVLGHPLANSYIPAVYYHLTVLTDEYGTPEEHQHFKDILAEKYFETSYYDRYQWEKRWKNFSKLKEEQPAQVVAGFRDFVDSSQLFTSYVDFVRSLYKTKTENGNYRYPYVSEALEKGVKQHPISYESYQLLTSYLAHTPRSIRQKDGIQPPVHPIVRQADFLYQTGLRDMAFEEVDFYLVNADKSQKWLYIYSKAMIYHNLGQHNYAIKMINDFINNNSIDKKELAYFAKLLYPRPYWDMIKKYAAEYNVDPYLVVSIMHRESHFDSVIRSHGNAYGLMQVVPPTAKDMAKRLGLRLNDDNVVNVLRDAESNIQLGTYYLSWLSRYFDGNFHYILAGYNAGPGNTRKWIREFGTDNLEQFAAKLPYPETEKYLQRVNDAYVIYKVLYEE